jgi:hypothetical protein
MSNLKNTYGFSQSLLDAILSVQENALKGKQSNIDVAEPKGKITAADFAKLRAMKKEEVEQIDEISKETKQRYLGTAVGDLATRAYKHGFKTAGAYKRTDSEIAAAERNIKNRQAGIHRATKEEVDLDEGGMPSSVIRSKQKYAAMTNQEFADLHGHKTEEQLRQMAWSHGYGKMSPHYWNRVQKAKATQMKEEVEQLEEAQNLIPLISQLKALLSWLVSSGAIRKFAKEEADVVGMLELLEYRTPGSKNGQRKERKSTGAARGRPKNSDSMQSKSNENEELDSAPAYDSASRDTKEGFRHVLTDIQNAADSSTGGTVVQDKQKQRHLPQKTAQQLLNIFRTAKPAVNAELSGHIFANREIPLRSPHHIAAYKAMKGAGEITSLPNGRGRPANEQ